MPYYDIIYGIVYINIYYLYIYMKIEFKDRTT